MSHPRVVTARQGIYVFCALIAAMSVTFDALPMRMDPSGDSCVANDEFCASLQLGVLFMPSTGPEVSLSVGSGSISGSVLRTAAGDEVMGPLGPAKTLPRI